MTSIEKLVAILLSVGLSLAIVLTLAHKTSLPDAVPVTPDGRPVPAPPPGPPAKWQADTYEEAMQLGAQMKRPVLVDVGARWCMPCRRMEASLADGKVVAVLAARYVVVKVDGDQRRDLVRALGVSSYPTLLIVDPSDRPAVVKMTVGSKTPDELVGWLN